jgi:hypothetical protein
MQRRLGRRAHLPDNNGMYTVNRQVGPLEDSIS